MHSSLEYRWIESTEQLHGLREDWLDLWMRDPNATPFQSPDWLLPWWECFGQKDLRVLAAEKRGALTALLPFYIYPDPATHEQRLLLLGVGTSDYLDGLFAPECTPQDVRNALDVLLERDGWDSLSVSQLRPESRLFEAACQGSDLSPEQFVTEPCSRMPAVPIGQLPQKIRRNAVYYRKRAERFAKLEFLLAGPENLDEILEALVDLHTARWQAQGEPGVFADPRMVQWHRNALPLMQKHGILRLWALRIEGEIAAVVYSVIDPPIRENRSLYIYITGFSSKYAEHRPGTLLLAYAIDHAAAEGIHTVDMLRGDEGYKKMWHTEPCSTFGFSLSHEHFVAATSEAAA